MKKEQKETWWEQTREPKWLTKLLGILCCGAGLLAVGLSVYSFIHKNEWVYFLLCGGIFFAMGLMRIFSDKGWPFGWKNVFAACEEAREEPDCLSENFSTEEKLEHLEIMREQGVLSDEAIEEKKRKIQKEETS